MQLTICPRPTKPKGLPGQQLAAIKGVALSVTVQLGSRHLTGFWKTINVVPVNLVNLPGLLQYVLGERRCLPPRWSRLARERPGPAERFTRLTAVSQVPSIPGVNRGEPWGEP